MQTDDATVKRVPKGVQIAIGALVCAALLGWYGATNLGGEASYRYFDTLEEFLAAGPATRAGERLRIKGYVANGSIDAARHVVVQPGGSLDGGTGVLQVAGDWTNSGTFVASMGTIAFADGCGVTTATISSDSTFSTLSLTSSTAKTYQFAEGSTQTVSTHLHISGAPGNLLAIRSKTDGVQANIDLQGTQLVDWVDVKDNHAIGSSIGYPGNSVSSGNTTGWFAIAAVPALPLVGLLALMATMALGARRLLGPRPPNRVSAA